MHHVSVGATPERQIKSIFETDQVGKSIVFTIVKNPTNIRDVDLRQFRSQCRWDKHGQQHQNREGQKRRSRNLSIDYWHSVDSPRSTEGEFGEVCCWGHTPRDARVKRLCNILYLRNSYYRAVRDVSRKKFNMRGLSENQKQPGFLKW